MNTPLLRLLFLLFLVLTAPKILADDNTTVTICDDENLWPPYTFIRESASQPEVTGAMIELVDAIFKHSQLTYSLSLTPWKRCLYQVEHYSGAPAYEVFINGSFSEERAAKFLVSDRVYSSGAAYFYSQKTFPNGPDIKRLADAKDYTICGVHGYSYEMFNITADHIAISAGDLHAAFRLLKNNRCEIILNAYSVPFGSKFTDKPMIDDTIKARIFDELPHQQFHIFISRQSPRAEKLVSQINRSIQYLKNSGQADKIFRQYLPECGTDC
ncbi:substrate-binding periplasmic protein [Litoribacillus peritrichatus]|uniref:ABC transporter substrate-binding protein n=1 Tax=Litoribacillus peritrichatus TaxID=718191 RepID=A0ABP7ND34_9GAMM